MSISNRSKIRSGGAEFVTPREPTLDLTTEKDRAMLRTAIVERPKRWRGLTDSFKDRCIDQLSRAMDETEQIEDLDRRVAARCSITRTIALIENQNQKDDHKAAELERPQQTGPVQIVVVDVPAGLQGGLRALEYQNGKANNPDG